MARVLCDLDELNDPGSKGFGLERPSGSLELFVVRRGDRVFGYVNSCPHTGATLDWMPDQFLDRDKRLIQCATHDALFRIETGECIAGPCAGQGLTPVSVAVENGRVVLLAEEQT